MRRECRWWKVNAVGEKSDKSTCLKTRGVEQSRAMMMADADHYGGSSGGANGRSGGSFERNGSPQLTLISSNDYTGSPPSRYQGTLKDHIVMWGKRIRAGMHREGPGTRTLLRTLTIGIFFVTCTKVYRSNTSLGRSTVLHCQAYTLPMAMT